ncbi:MAG: hypothetical protein QXH20_03215 [Candidatus Bathyarchaeia archaeon]
MDSVAMSMSTTTNFDFQKVVDWLKRNWILVVIAIVVLLIVFRRRRRIIIE